MCLNLNLFFFSPLEQFEISSYNTFLTYITTFPVELFETNYILKYNPIVFYNSIDLLFIFIIIKSFQLLIKNDGFIFLYIFILVLLTCINIFSFTDFLLYESSFKLHNTGIDVTTRQIESYFNREGTVTAQFF